MLPIRLSDSGYMFRLVNIFIFTPWKYTLHMCTYMYIICVKSAHDMNDKHLGYIPLTKQKQLDIPLHFLLQSP
jgi:hypothetical protein